MAANFGHDKSDSGFVWEDIEINPTDRLCDFCNRDGSPKSRKHESAIVAFKKKLHEIQDVGLDPGIVLLMVNKKYFYIWDTIPYGEMNMVRDYIHANRTNWWHLIVPRWMSEEYDRIMTTQRDHSNISPPEIIASIAAETGV